jgi:CDP-4-dehydro-6-deoxyglucose reductase
MSSGRSFRCEASVSILDAALSNGITLPYSCKTGRCSSCKTKILSGQTKALQSEMGLNDGQKNEGWVLSCVRAVISDVTIDIEDLGGIAVPRSVTLPCRITEIDRLAHDVIRVKLRLPPSSIFEFIPGQYVEIIGPNGVRRSYSLANANYTNKTIELHIRAVSNGAMSNYWFSLAKVNDLLRLHGPMGTFFLRSVASIDVVFLATGTGIAPVKAMLESIVGMPSSQMPRSITVFWGGRKVEDFYWDVQSIPVGHRFVPVLSRPDPSWMGEVGYVQDVLLKQKPDLRSMVVYACGSIAMIQSAQAALTHAGLAHSRFLSDAFVSSST